MRFWSWCISDKATPSSDSENGNSSSFVGQSRAKKQKAPSPTNSKAPQVTSKRPDDLFNVYADADRPNTIGAEGLEKLCADAEVPMDGAQPLLLAWQLDAKEMGSFTREEWSRGMEKLKPTDLKALATALSDLEDLLIFRKPAPKRPAAVSVSRSIKQKSALSSMDRYNKDEYWSRAADVKASFLSFYSFCFALAKEEGSRNIDMEVALAFWSVILVPTYPLMAEVIEFITEKGSYRGVNKDLWIMMEEFCRTVDPSLEGYDNDGAWPTLLDDFVTWKKAKAVN